MSKQHPMSYAPGDLVEIEQFLASRGYALFLRKIGMVVSDDLAALVQETEHPKVARYQGRVQFAQSLGAIGPRMLEECRQVLKDEE